MFMAKAYERVSRLQKMKHGSGNFGRMVARTFVDLEKYYNIVT